MTTQLLANSGHLVVRSGHLVATADPSTCSCCGPPPPDPCAVCANGTVPTSWGLSLTGAADSGSCSGCNATFNNSFGPIAFVGGSPTCQWVLNNPGWFASHCTWFSWSVQFNVPSVSLGVPSIQLAYVDGLFDSVHWELPFPTGSQCNEPLTFSAANITHSVAGSCDFSGATLTLTPSGPFFNTCCDFSQVSCSHCPDATSPSTAKIALSGFAGPDALGHCASCGDLNKTYLLTAVPCCTPYGPITPSSGQCVWVYSEPSLQPCDNTAATYSGVWMMLTLSAGFAQLTIVYAYFDSGMFGPQSARGLANFTIAGNCLDVVDQASDSAYSESNGFSGTPVCGSAGVAALTFLL